MMVTIEYPNLPAILAQFSFIFSGLMTFGILFNFFNNKKMKGKLLQNMGNIYFDKISFEKDKNQMEEISQILLEKCNFLNMMFEISKI